MQEIWHGDCLKLMKGIQDQSIDMVLTSPPYDNLRTYNGSLEWNEEIWQDIILDLYRIVKVGGVVVWIVSDATINGSETGTSFSQALWAKKCGFNLHDTMIWDKGNFTAVGALKTSYAPVFEYMFIWSRGRPKTFNPIKDRKNKYFGTTYHQTVRQADGSTKAGHGKGVKQISEYGQRHNVWHIAPEKSNSKRCHPAQYPETIAHDHIISWSNENDIILDPFVGSGTTCLVAKALNRQFIGIEKEKEYYDICVKRLGLNL